MRLDLEEDESIGVDMAPLIDCVFLLLIFFLVTTMMKKWESQIRLDVPESTSTLSTRKTDSEHFVIALGNDGSLHTLVDRNRHNGELSFVPIADLARHLAELRRVHGTGIPLEISAERSIPVDRVIEVFDICQLNGFRKARVRLGSPPRTEPEP